MATYDHYITIAIQSIFLGARIHDAAVLCGKTDREMRDFFISFCKKNNSKIYELVSIEAANKGCSTPPVDYFRKHIFDFISLENIHPGFMLASLEEMDSVSDYLDRCLGKASANTSLWRARRDSWNGLMALMNSKEGT